MIAIFVLAFKRLLSQRGLALATTVGLVIALALTLSVPLYAGAVYDRVLREELVTNEEDAAPTPAQQEDGTEPAKAEDPSLVTSQEKRPENES